MATNTMIALDKVTVGTAVSSVTFTGVSQAYTDLDLVANFDGSSSSYVTLTFNSVTGSSYSRTRLIGTGSAASSDRTANTAGIINLTYNTAGTPVLGTYHIMSYGNSTTYKTVLARDAAQPDNVAAHVGMFRGSTGSSTEAITSITLTKVSGNFTVGSTFSLYGIKAEPQIVSKATGGTIYYGVDGYVYHKFTSSGTFTPSSTLSCDVLTIAGGGGGGNLSAGGGAGGLLYSTAQSFSSAQTVTIGGGGAGGSGFSGQAASGINSSVGSLIAIGGGGAGKSYNSGINGGSGGGAGVFATTGGTATSGQGFAGGTGTGGFDAGGGGGAGAVGGNGTQSPSRKSGDGGVGASSYSQWGIVTSSGQTVSGVVYYAGGGGGGGSVDNSLTVGVGGYGGGAAGNNNGNGYSGTSNTGGGGGGGGQLSGVTYDGGAGGSGIVIIRYKG